MEQLIKMRQKLGLTQAQMGVILGVERFAISRAETNLRYLPLKASQILDQLEAALTQANEAGAVVQPPVPAADTARLQKQNDRLIKRRLGKLAQHIQHLEARIAKAEAAYAAAQAQLANLVALSEAPLLAAHPPVLALAMHNAAKAARQYSPLATWPQQAELYALNMQAAALAQVMAAPAVAYTKAVNNATHNGGL
jgi:hypothetical protein